MAKTCCPLGWRVREHECISLFLVLLPFPLIWSIRLGTHTHKLSLPLFVMQQWEESQCRWKPLAFLKDHYCYYIVSYRLYVSWRKGMTSLFVSRRSVLPSTDARLGRIVMAPSATLSWPITGEILEPQLSEPTHRKWPVWLFLLAASRTRLVEGKTE